MLRFCIFGTLLAPPALAADEPRIAIVGVHQPELGDDAQARAVQGLVQAIEAAGRFDALSPTEVAEAIRGREGVIIEEGLLGSARERLTTGKGLYNQAATVDAIATLEAAVGDYRLAMPAANTVAGLWEAWLYIGSSQLQRDDPDQDAAARAFRHALAIAPGRPVSGALFPPAVTRTFIEQSEILKAHPLILQVTADGPAEIWVDGVKRGRAPLTLTDMLPGEHFVVARGAGTQGYAHVETPLPALNAVVPLRSDGIVPPPNPPTTESVHVSMRAPTLGKSAATPVARSRQISALYTALGNRAEGVDYLLLVGVDDSQLQLQLLNPDSHAFSRPVQVPFSGTAEDEAVHTVPLLLKGIDKSGGFIASSPSAVSVGLADNSVLASLLTDPGTAAALAGARGPNTRSPSRPEPQPEGPEKEAKKGKAGAIVGTTLAVLAAGAAGTGIYLATQSSGPRGGTIIVQF